MMKIFRSVLVFVLLLSVLGSHASTLAKPPDQYHSFLPVIHKSLAVLDISIAGIEVTQAVQTPGNSVPLVEGRPALARIYVTTSPAQELGNISLTLSAMRNGAVLPGSPVTIGPATVPASYSRANLSTSFNATLPAGWLSGTVSLVATVDPGNVVPEFNEGNNVSVATLVFNYVPPLNVVIVPVNYTHTPTGQVFPGPTTDIVGDYTMRIYPINRVNVSIHAPVAFSGDLSSGTEWSRYLRFVTDLKNSEGAPSSTIYYGYTYSQNASGAKFTAPYAGMAWIGSRTAVGVGPRNVVWGDVAAHEFGHNLGRYHAPCGNAPNPDPAYPYAGGIIGQYGYDIIARTVMNPTLPDIMTYCEPEWVSDYTYVALYENQRQRGAAPEPAALADSFLVSISFGADGSVSFSPVYPIQAPLTAPAGGPGEFTIELLGAGGDVFASYPVSLIESEATQEGTFQAIHTVVPRPALAVDRLRLLQRGTVIAEKVLAESPLLVESAAAQVVQDSGTVSLSWGSPTVPALVRYSPGSGLPWTTLAIGVLGGSYDVPAESLPAGEGLFQVVLADRQDTMFQFQLSR